MGGMQGLSLAEKRLPWRPRSGGSGQRTEDAGHLLERRAPGELEIEEQDPAPYLPGSRSARGPSE